jgi:tRNA dimethylallyltransferase
MYLQWLVHGRPDAIKPSAAAVTKAASVVEKFQRQEEGLTDLEIHTNSPGVDEEKGWNGAIAHTSSLGTLFADRVSKLPGKDWYRLRRTLEVAYTAMDSENSEGVIRDLYNGERQGSLESRGYDVRCFFLCPSDRMAHTAVVDGRCEDMLCSGLLKETMELRSTGQLPDNAQHTRAIGYRQTLKYLERSEFELEDSKAFGSYLDEFTTATRRYAKKQMQWFRRDGKFLFVPINLSDPSSERVNTAANIIQNMCKLSRVDYEKELMTLSESEKKELEEMQEDDMLQGGDIKISAKTKFFNEEQGKKMKFYIFKRQKLSEGSSDYHSVVTQADKYAQLIQNHSN